MDKSFLTWYIKDDEGIFSESNEYYAGSCGQGNDLEYAHYSVDKAYDVDAMVWTSVEYCLGDFIENYNYLIEYDEE